MSSLHLDMKDIQHGEFVWISDWLSLMFQHNFSYIFCSRLELGQYDRWPGDHSGPLWKCKLHTQSTQIQFSVSLSDWPAGWLTDQRTNRPSVRQSDRPSVYCTFLSHAGLSPPVLQLYLTGQCHWVKGVALTLTHIQLGEVPVHLRFSWPCSIALGFP